VEALAACATNKTSGNLQQRYDWYFNRFGCAILANDDLRDDEGAQGPDRQPGNSNGRFLISKPPAELQMSYDGNGSTALSGPTAAPRKLDSPEYIFDASSRSPLRD